MFQKSKLLMLQLLLAAILISLLCVGMTGYVQSEVISVLKPLLNEELDSDVSTPQSPTEDNAVIYWDSFALQLIRATRPGPPVVARTLAVLHTAIYEAWSQYDEQAVGTLLGDRFRQPAEARTLVNKREAISYAAYRVLSDLFPDSSQFGYPILDFALMQAGYDPLVTTTDPTKPAGIGNLAAAIVLSYRHDDRANQRGSPAYSDNTGYRPTNRSSQVNDLNHWQPLQTPNGSFQGGCITGGALVTQTYVGPHWGNVIPFALNDGEVITPSLPPAHYPSPEFTLQAQEVISISANLTDRQKAIAEYWADGPASELPPGHWALIAQFVSFRDQHTLDEDVKLFFALTNANLDASILAWKLKRLYDSVRPITAIRELYRGQEILAWAGPYSGTQRIAGETWQPYQQLCFVTPAFPEFLSGHSTFSAASAEVLKSFTGSDTYGNLVVIPAGSSLVEPGLVPTRSLVLSWPTFSAAADEAGISRRYGGIHFERGDLEGRAVGRRVGARAWQKAQHFFAGSATPVANMEKVISATLAINNVIYVLYPQQFYLPIIQHSVPEIPVDTPPQP